MNYQVIPLRGQEQYDLNGVRFDGKSFLFWKRKSTQEIREIIVIFNKNYENMQVRDGVMIVSFKGLNNYNDLRNAMRIFMQIIRDNRINVQLHFMVENENERQVAEALGKEFGLSYVVQNVNQNQERNLRAMEESLKNNTERELATGGNQIIDKYDNGKLKQITVHNEVAYENNGLLNSEEEKVSLLREWMKDPVKARELENLSEDARNDLLTKAVMANKTAYRLENVDKQVVTDEVGEVAMNVAEHNSGLVNSKLGIVQNDITNSNQFSAVERNGDDVQVVNPDITQTHITTSSGVNNTGTDGSINEFQDYDDVKMNEEEKERDLTDQVYYVDEESNIRNNNGDIIGKLGYEGYSINYEDNSLMKYGQTVGYIGDYNDMGKDNTNVYSKPKVRTLTKDDTKSAAFASLSVIIFILSALLLIGAIVLLFVLD